MQLQHKSFAFELKDVTDSGTFEGYAAAFGNVDAQGDIVEAGAFTVTLKESKGVVPILWQHKTDQVVGYGIDAIQDFRGLLVRGEFTLGHPQGQMAYATVQHAQKVGHKMGLSIGFLLDKKGAFVEEGGVRRLKKINLMEYSIATFPANDKARLERVKNADDMTERDFEDTLRDLGFSKKESLIIVAKGFRELSKGRREAGSETDEAVQDDEAVSAMFKSIEDRFSVDSWLNQMSQK